MKSNYVCFKCRVSRRSAVACPSCGGVLEGIGFRCRPPRHDDVRRWRRLERYVHRPKIKPFVPGGSCAKERPTRTGDRTKKKGRGQFQSDPESMFTVYPKNRRYRQEAKAKAPRRAALALVR